MEIKTADYNVWTEGAIIHYEGTLRLSGTDAYQPILDLMQGVLAEKPRHVVLDLTQLEFLNSSGINLLAKFTIELRKQPDIAEGAWFHPHSLAIEVASQPAEAAQGC